MGRPTNPTTSFHRYPEIFWAGYASSAMVKAKECVFVSVTKSAVSSLLFFSFFRAYWDSVANKMPKSCAKNVAAVVEYFDDVVADHGKSEIEEVVMKLRLSQFEHLDDIAEIRMSRYKHIQIVCVSNANF